MSSSSLSFPPGNQALYRPSNSDRTKNPFVRQCASTPANQNLPFQSAQTPNQLSQFTNNANTAPITFQYVNQTVARQPGSQAVGTPEKKSAAKPEEQSGGKEGKDKKTVGPLGFVFPIMTLIGTPMMLVTSLLGINKTKNNHLEFNPKGFSKFFLGLNKDKQGNVTYKPKLLARKLFKNLDTKDALTAEREIGKKLLTNYKVGRGVLALGIIPKSLIGIMYGIQAQQPSILFAHLLQLPLVGMILKENKTATTLVYLMGGLFTLGFINDTQNGQIKDKLPGSEHEKTRYFDMSRFKQAFALHSGLSFGSRIAQSIGEFGKMIKFSMEDHIISAKRAFQEINKLRHGEKNELTDLRTTGSISKSSLGFLLSYAATIPALLSAALIRKESSKTAAMLSKYSMATTLLSGLMLNFGMILVALNGKNWAERVPMVGTSMELSGTVMGYSPSSILQPIALALQQLGGGLNSIFYASKAQKD